MPSRKAATLYPNMLALCCLCALAYPLPVLAQANAQATQTVAYDISAGPLEAALNQFSIQSKLQTIYSPELVAGRTVPGLSERLSPEEALRRLLQGTGLTWDAVNESMFVLKRDPNFRPPVDTSAERGGTTAATPAQSEAEPKVLDTVTVTGTRIRGGSTPSPVITIDAGQIQEEGFTDLGDVIRSVPQNFTGGQNPGVIPFTISGAGIQNQNVTGGSTLNLRGLGPDATLTLLNGRRMAYSGFSQAVDISAIPVDAVERIEIVADGASAIYGSDAVGGVANVILKRDHEGVAIGARYGGATDGGLATREYTATGGATWASGGLIATYKDASIDPIYARQREYTNHLRDPYTVYPGSDLSSGLLSVHQSLGTVAELRLDAFRTERDQLYSVHDNVSGLTVLATPDTTTTLVSPSVEFFISNDWTLSIGGAWAESEHVQQSLYTFETGAVAGSIHDCNCNESRTYEVGAEGPLFTLPGGDSRLAIGAGYRSNDYRQFNYLTGASTTQGGDSSRFVYAEINLPLVGPESTAAAVHRLALTAAVRGEDYDTFGSVNTPKLGLIYGPSPDFTLKASWGESFKTPTQHQRYYMNYALLDPATSWGGTGDVEGATALVSGGGNRQLGPERARSWASSLAFHPRALPGLDLELTWFDIDYTDRVVEPLANFSQALTNPIYAQFVVRSPSEQQQAALVADADVFYNYTGAPYDPANVVAILYAQYVNVARQRIRGLDLTGSYGVDLTRGQLAFRGSGSWLDSSQQTTPADSVIDLAGTLHNPPKISSRIGVVWTQGGFTASTFANYKGGVQTLVEGESTSSFTTFDATLRYSTERRSGLWSGLDLSLSAHNVLDRSPPLHTPTSIYLLPPYDATNYTPIGRLLNASVTKHW